MKPKISIKKIMLVAASAVIGGGLLTLLIAANNKEDQQVCKGVEISIKGAGEDFYIEKGDIEVALKRIWGGNLIGQSVDAVDLARLENQLEENEWIRKADLYFDSHNVLYVKIEEREPVARVFTTAGSSFYIDSSALRMPLLQKVSVRVPVVTNFTNAKRLSKKDSALLKDVKVLTRYILSDPFWKAQIAQIDIVGNGMFELVPVVGNHIIRVGTVENIDKKLNRLLIFYQQAMSKIGFDKYDVLDVQYEGQVVGVHKGSASAVDSLQLHKNIEALLKKDQLLQGQKEATAVLQDAGKENQQAATEKPVETKKAAIEKPQPEPANVKARPKPVEQKKVEKGEEKRKPKAVMQKRERG